MTSSGEKTAMKKIGEQFFRELNTELLNMGIDLRGKHVDHLCYRVSTDAEYQEVKTQLCLQSELLGEAMIAGRPIATFRMNEPFCVDGFSIPLLELPAPKSNSPYSTGFEHAEVVLKESFESIEKKYPHCRFEQNGRKNLNPELEVVTPAGKLKFHHHPLDRILQIEQAHLTDIIFDLDGTLIDSVESVREVNRQVFSSLLQREISEEESKKNYRPNFPSLFEAFGIRNPQDQIKGLQLWSQFARDEIGPLFPGILELLSELLQQGYRLHLWTARESVSTNAILEHYQLSGFFTSISTASAACSKPDFRSLNWNFMSYPANSVLVLGDSTSDILGAQQIQALAAGVTWCKHANYDNLVSAGMEICFHQIKEVLPWLNHRKTASTIDFQSK